MPIDHMKTHNDARSMTQALENSSENVVASQRWLRIDDLILYTGFSKSLVYKLLDSGLVPSVHLKFNERSKRGVRVVDRNKVDEFLKSRETNEINA